MSNDTAYCHHCGGDQDVQHYTTIHPPGAESYTLGIVHYAVRI